MKIPNFDRYLRCCPRFSNSFLTPKSSSRAPILLILLSIVGISVSGCSSTSSNLAKQRPQFLSKPEILIAPVKDTPMVRILTLKTDVPVRVTVDIDAQGKKWSIEFEDYDTAHSLALYGFHPGKNHTLRVHVFNLADRKTTYVRPLTVSMPALPSWFPIIKVESDPGKMEPGYTLFNVMPEGDNKKFSHLLLIVDEIGTVVWYRVSDKFSDVRKLSNGNLLSIEGNKIVEFDMRGLRLKEWQSIGDLKLRIEGVGVATESFHHEVFPMENGNLLSLSIELRDYQNYRSSETDHNAATETASVAGDVIVEFTPGGTIVNRWSLLDMLDPYRLGFDSLTGHWDSVYNKQTRDWSHANAVIHDPNDDTIIVSVRHQDATIKFSRKTGKLIWILGPHQNWDKAKYGKLLLKPTIPDENFFPFHTHAPMVLANGNLLIYDNGNHRRSPFSAEQDPEEGSPFSRAVEYSIDETSREVELIWQYGQSADNQYYADALGDADALPITGNVLITHGNLPGEQNKMSARVIEVTHSKPAKEVFHMHVSDRTKTAEAGWRIYRAERISSLYP